MKIYSDYINLIQWSQIVTFRPHYNLREATATKVINRLLNNSYIDAIFWALERDRTYNSCHVHILIKSSKNVKQSQIAKDLKTNKKAVTYIGKVRSNKAVSKYCTKHIKSVESYDIRIK